MGWCVHFLFDSLGFVEQNEFFVQLLFLDFNVPCSFGIGLFFGFRDDGAGSLFGFGEDCFLHFFDTLFDTSRDHCDLFRDYKSEIMEFISYEIYHILWSTLD